MADGKSYPKGKYGAYTQDGFIPLTRPRKPVNYDQKVKSPTYELKLIFTARGWDEILQHIESANSPTFLGLNLQDAIHELLKREDRSWQTGSDL
jgi:hypothetical protein